MKKVIFLLFFSSILLSGCALPFANMTVASTKNFYINSGKLITGNRVTGEDYYPIFLIFRLGQPSMQAAMMRAIDTNKCAVGLTNVEVKYTNMILFGHDGYSVTGNLLLDPTLSGCGSLKNDYE